MDIREVLSETKYKIKSNYRLYYEELEEIEKIGFFKNRGDTFLCSFAIGYHFKATGDLKNSISVVNTSSLSLNARGLVVELIHYRHPDLKTAEDIWKMAEGYAEWGIQVLYNSVISNNNHLFIDDILQK